MKKVKVSIVDSTTLKLEENANIGDIIDLQELQKVDTSQIIELINKEKDNTYNQMISERLKKETTIVSLQVSQKKDEENSKKIKEYNEIIRNKEKQINELNFKLKNLSENQQLLIEKEKYELNNKINSELAQKNEKINQLTLLIEKNKVLEAQKLNEKNKEIFSLNEQIKNKELIKNMEIENQVFSIKEKLEKEVSKKELELTQLKMSRSNLQIKMLGEELEQWCNSEYESYALSGFDNCSWYKDNTAIKEYYGDKATKADYIFEVYANNRKDKSDKLVTVVCEMKNEAHDSKNKTKNSDHYAKLDKDRHKKNGQYALLISELEWNTVNDAPIKKIDQYENMYMVRPAYFISFLSLINSLANKYKDLLTERKIVDKNFKSSQDILEEFEKFKNTYLDKPLNNLIKEIEDIKKEATKAQDSVFKILDITDKIITNKISEIKQKINNFDIKKIAKKIDKLEII